VELVLRLDDDLIEALLDRPDFLLLGERSKMALAAPVPSRPTDPRVEHAPAVEVHILAEPADKVGQLCIDLAAGDFMRDFEGNRNDRTGVVRQWRARKKDEVRAAVQAARDFGRSFLARKLAKVLLDVLDLECSLFEIVLCDVIFHGWEKGHCTRT